MRLYEMAYRRLLNAAVAAGDVNRCAWNIACEAAAVVARVRSVP